MCLFVRLVLAGVSLRGGERVMTLFAGVCGLSIGIPHWTTGRMWLLRLGHALLTMPLEHADDWAWLVDHSVQIGQEKCLAVLGIRLGDLPPPGESLQHTDMKLIALVPRTSWTRAEVAEALKQATARTGVPRVIVNDHGVDVHGGVQIFQQQYPQTAEIYDIKHKAACLLKQRLQKDPRWAGFQTHLAQTRCAIQQTELSFLNPPAPKPKARFMNLQPQLEWAEGVLDVLRHPPAHVLQWTTSDRLPQKLGWLTEYGEAVSEWSSWQQVTNIAVEQVNRHGLSRTTAKQLRREFPRRFSHNSAADVAKELVSFVSQQAKQTKPGERLPGSTEVLESTFGKMKALEKQQSRGGFTSLLVSFGALLTDATTDVIQNALRHSGVAHVHQWCQENLGTTLFAKRKLTFAKRATKAR